jgi:hypothetical protein
MAKLKAYVETRALTVEEDGSFSPVRQGGRSEARLCIAYVDVKSGQVRCKTFNIDGISAVPFLIAVHDSEVATDWDVSAVRAQLARLARVDEAVVAIIFVKNLQKAVRHG